MLDPSCALQSVSISHHLAVKSRSVVQTLYIYNLSTGSSLWLYVYNSWTRRVTTGIISPGNAVCLSDILFSANVMWHRGRMFDQRRWKVSWDVARWWISGFQPCWVRGPGGWEKKKPRGGLHLDTQQPGRGVKHVHLTCREPSHCQTGRGKKHSQRTWLCRLSRVNMYIAWQ